MQWRRDRGMLGIDTNILLRIFLTDLSEGDRTPDQLALVRDAVVGSREPFFVNHVVVVETIWVLRQKLKYSKEIIAGVMTRLLHMSNVMVQDAATVEASLSSFIAYPGDFSDHLIGEINKRNGCRTTLTFDRAASKSPNFSELQR
ncbi:PIN domain-containing protein [Rhizobium leguminosarum]|nr:PIN domain-containing protein [Rhizobium leguminosarum]TAX11136.1 PIN domain-containing protein [Rhizobium leguminosarum]TAX56946.1 PIN domain-containing protein [Rhizobium leguminosarum]TAX61454.1 PIN domain-containing protein [Rhizobium leguminosarum]TAY02886.1 PIN domain-containing protein [Rhizobium leguminosarum]